MSSLVDSEYNNNLNKFIQIAKQQQQQLLINENKLIKEMNEQELEEFDEFEDPSFKGLTGLSEVFAGIKAKSKILPSPPSPEKPKLKTPTPILSSTTLNTNNNNNNNNNNGNNNNDSGINNISDFDFSDPFDDPIPNNNINNNIFSKTPNINNNISNNHNTNNINKNQFFSPSNVINSNNIINNRSNNELNNSHTEFSIFEEDEALIINKKTPIKNLILEDTEGIDLTSPKKISTPSLPKKPSNFNINNNNSSINSNSNNNNISTIKQPIKKDYNYIINSNHHPIINRYKAIILDLMKRKEELKNSKPENSEDFKDNFIETTNINEKIEELEKEIIQLEIGDLNSNKGNFNSPTTPIISKSTQYQPVSSNLISNNNSFGYDQDFSDFGNNFDDQDFSEYNGNKNNSYSSDNSNVKSSGNNNNNIVDDDIDYINLDDDDIIIEESKSTFNNNNNNNFNNNSISNSFSSNFKSNLQAVFVDVDNEINKYKGTNFEWSNKIVQINRDIFGFNGFRENQREIINSVLDNKDTFVLMPTGGGKSLCYQIPALYKSGITIVVSPLISLIEDQVSFLVSLKYPAAALSSNVSSEDAQKVYRDLRSSSPKIRLLYVTPERIASSESFLGILEKLYQNNQFSRIVIDEAHCVSQWGHDFRPDYKELSILRKKFKEVPILALTATATEKVRNDVILNLLMRKPVCFKQSFNRPNLIYQVVKKGKEVSKNMADFINKNYPDKSGIVYCLSKYDCDKISNELRGFKIKAEQYHAGLDVKIRNKVQGEWQKGKVKVIVATIAFGMGINKPDVRFVLHHTVPKSLEGYYQESGRAGRDGLVSHCMLYYKWSDKIRLESMLFSSSRENGTTYNLKESRSNLNKMIGYCENDTECRRALQLSYFGENFDKTKCKKTCDNCSLDTPVSDKDVTKEAKEIVSVVQKANGNETLSTIVYILRGSKNKKTTEVVELHNLKSLYGIKKNWKQTDIERVAHELILRNILTELITQNNYGSTFSYIGLGPLASNLLSGKINVSIKVRSESKEVKKAPSKNKRKNNNDDEEDDDEQDVVVIGIDDNDVSNKSNGDNELEQRLEILRQDIAALENKGENNIFPYSTIKCLVKVKPTKIENLNHGIEALPSSKVERYGIFIIRTIQDYINGKRYSTIDKSEFKSHTKNITSTYLSVDPPSLDEDDFDLDVNPDDFDDLNYSTNNSTSKRKLNNSIDIRPTKK